MNRLLQSGIQIEMPPHIRGKQTRNRIVSEKLRIWAEKMIKLSYFCSSKNQKFKLTMETIQVRDKKFVVSIPKEKIKARVEEVAAAISDELKGEKPLFLSVLNGAFIFAADLLRGITIPCEITFVRLASYSGVESTGKVTQILGLDTSIEGRTVVIVEDIIDSGLTMQKLLASLETYKPAKVIIAALLVKPEKLKVSLDIKHCCFNIPNDFILGYGLDYDGEGRNLPDIYTVTE